MSYADIQQLSAIGGMMFFIGIFLGVTIYAFRRKNQNVFNRAAHAALEDSERPGQ